MEKNKYRADFHNHPLCHKYYPNDGKNHLIELDEDDRRQIEKFIHHCIDVRKLDVVAITDHDLVQSSLYAKQYAQENNLDIKVVTGTELELYLGDVIDVGFEHLSNSQVVYFTNIYGLENAHFLVLGIEELPEYNVVCNYKSFKEFVDTIHESGGYIIMSHPQFSVKTFFNVIPYIDGFELLNSDHNYFPEGLEFCKELGISKPAYVNSDFHIFDEWSYKNPPIHKNVNIIDDELFNKLYK